MGNIPAPGEHTGGVVAWRGYGEGEIVALCAGSLI